MGGGEEGERERDISMCQSGTELEKIGCINSNKLFHCGGLMAVSLEHQTVRNAFPPISCANVIFAHCKNVIALEQYLCIPIEQEHLHEGKQKS